MVRRVSMDDARIQFPELSRVVSATGEALEIEQDGEPIVVVVTPEQWAALQRAEQRASTMVDELRARNAHHDPDDILAAVSAEVEDERQAMHEGRRFPL